MVVENVKFLVARKDFPAKTLPEFIAYAKANQKTMQYGSAGIASATHVTCVLLNYAIGVDITHVPYRGTGPALQDLLGRPHRLHVRGDLDRRAACARDAIKALAILSPTRNAALPGVPTAHEQGLTNFDADGWNAFFFPRGTPDAIVRKLAQATSSVLDLPDVARAAGEGRPQRRAAGAAQSRTISASSWRASSTSGGRRSAPAA